MVFLLVSGKIGSEIGASLQKSCVSDVSVPPLPAYLYKKQSTRDGPDGVALEIIPALTPMCS